MLFTILRFIVKSNTVSKSFQLKYEYHIRSTFKQRSRNVQAPLGTQNRPVTSHVKSVDKSNSSAPSIHGEVRIAWCFMGNVHVDAEKVQDNERQQNLSAKLMYGYRQTIPATEFPMICPLRFHC